MNIRISKVLSAAIKDCDYDLILTGSMSVDNGASQVAVRVAEELNLAHVATAVELTIDSDKVTVVKDVEGNSEVIEASSAFTCNGTTRVERAPLSFSPWDYEGEKEANRAFKYR